MCTAGREAARNHGLDCGRGDLLANSFLIQPAFETRPHVRVLFRHDCNSLILFSPNVSLAALDPDFAAFHPGYAR
jgi:hypothetical protein